MASEAIPTELTASAMSIGQGPFSFVHPSVLLSRNVKYGYAGLFAAEKLARGTTVVGWAGRIITEAQIALMAPGEDSYLLQIDDDLYQAPIRAGVREPADFTNHSCDPNCGFSSPITLVTMRDVQPGEELTFSYAMSDSNDRFGEFTCMCGAVNCRGSFTGSDWKDPALQKRFKGYFSPYLERRIARMQAAAADASVAELADLVAGAIVSATNDDGSAVATTSSRPDPAAEVAAGMLAAPAAKKQPFYHRTFDPAAAAVGCSSPPPPMPAADDCGSPATVPIPATAPAGGAAPQPQRFPDVGIPW